MAPNMPKLHEINCQAKHVSAVVKAGQGITRRARKVSMDSEISAKKGRRLAPMINQNPASCEETTFQQLERDNIGAE
jgi:hypothetical protein